MVELEELVWVMWREVIENLVVVEQIEMQATKFHWFHWFQVDTDQALGVWKVGNGGNTLCEASLYILDLVNVLLQGGAPDDGTVLKKGSDMCDEGPPRFQ